MQLLQQTPKELKVYHPKCFSLEELVPKSVFNLRGSKCIELFSLEILLTIDEIRELINAPMTVNDWKWGGSVQYRGFRPFEYYSSKLKENPKYIPLSQHIFGNAIDFVVKEHPADKIREKLIGWKKEGKLKHLTGMEMNISWVHIDCRQSDRLDENDLFLFNP